MQKGPIRLNFTFCGDHFYQTAHQRRVLKWRRAWPRRLEKFQKRRECCFFAHTLYQTET